MQYMWQWRLYGAPEQRLTDGRPLRIIHPGLINKASGPDFFNAKLHMDQTAWAGNVELHVKATDWHRHNHHLDAAYDTVILHVVGENDTYITRADGSIIPQLVMPFNKEISCRYATLASNDKPLRCRAYIADVPPLFIHDAIDACAMGRLQSKADRITDSLKFTGNDLAHTAMIALARALGFGLNSQPFEMLGRSITPTIIASHADSDFQLEAILLGNAGMLDSPHINDDYYRQLQQEYDFLAHKFNLKTLPAHLWKFSGIRPTASPLRRLVYLARLLRNATHIASKWLDAKGDLARLREQFVCNYSGYWANHLIFGKESTRNYSKAIGATQIDVIILNAVAPFYYAYGQLFDAHYMELAIELWQQIPPESNSTTRLWAEMTAIHPANAWESQGLLQLTTNYCLKADCLRCRIAHQALRRSIK